MKTANKKGKEKVKEKSKAKEPEKTGGFEKFAARITRFAGSNFAFFSAFGIVVVWFITGPVFHYSDTWQLVINTGTTIITFLMVFLIQKTQNKDSIAIQMKLNELVASNSKASNRLVNVEELSEEELVTLSEYYSKLAALTKKEQNLQVSHSIEEAHDKVEEKVKKKKAS